MSFRGGLWVCLWALVVVSCGESTVEDSGSGLPAEDVQEPSPLADSVGDEVGVGEPVDSTSWDTQEPQEPADMVGTVEPTPGLMDCPESVLNPFQTGEEVIYTCVAVGEVLSVQHVRSVKKAQKTINVLAVIEPPERLGQTLHATDEAVFFDTQTVDNALVTGRDVWRVPAQGGEREAVLSFRPEDSVNANGSFFGQPTRVMVFRVQPGAQRVAFVLSDLTSHTGEGHLYIYHEGEQIFTSEGVVSAFSWNVSGSQLAWLMGGSLMISGVDGSGAAPIDPVVFTTGVPPRYIESNRIVYAGTKKGLRVWKGGTKEDVGVAFPDDIEALEVVDSSTVLVMAGGVFLVNVDEGTSVEFGEPPLEGPRKPLALDPAGDGYLIGGSLDNPFKSFEYRLYSFDAPGDQGSAVITTGPKAGVVSTAVVWR